MQFVSQVGERPNGMHQLDPATIIETAENLAQ